jgi:hypothetical protein
MTGHETISLWLSGGALLAGLAAVIISICAYTGSQRLGRQNVLHQLKTSIDDAKDKFEQVGIELVRTRRQPDAAREVEILEATHKARFERILNAYETACQKYQAKLVLRDEFKTSYFDDIRLFVEEEPGRFTGEFIRYRAMRAVYQEWHQP